MTTNVGSIAAQHCYLTARKPRSRPSLKTKTLGIKTKTKTKTLVFKTETKTFTIRSRDISRPSPTFASFHDCRLKQKIFQLPSFCISGLLPPLRDSTIISRLRTPSLYPQLATRTKHYTSFIQHALLNYQ